MRVALIALTLAASLTGCATNWTYDVKSIEHDSTTGRYYVICENMNKAGREFIEVDISAEVAKLLEVDGPCPAPMSITPPPSSTSSSQPATT